MSRGLVVMVLMVVALRIGAWSQPLAAATISPEADELAADVAAFVDEQARRGMFSGAVLVAIDGLPVLEMARGLANRDFDVPNRVDTKFNLGSMNKMFTAVAIGQLVEAEELSFADRVGDHLPDYPNREVARKVTIHHLLTHTSGMGNYWTEEFMNASKDRFRAVADYLPLFVDQPLKFEPGTEWSYSNSGFMVLGLIIEQASGQTYFDYVRDHIYEPAGMINTDAYEVDTVVPNLAVGYTRMGAAGGEVKNNLFMHVVKGGPAGGGYSTVGDLIAFSDALWDTGLMTRDMAGLLTTGKVDMDGVSRRYGYGFQVLWVNDQRVVGHSGGFPGINSYLDMYVDLGYTVAVLSNTDNGATEVRDFILARLIGKTQWMLDRELTEAVLERTLEAGYDAGVTLHSKRWAEGTVAEMRLNQVGYELLEAGRTADAINVFRVNVYIYPESSNCHDSLGEAYMVSGQTERAIQSYQKSIELDPSNTNGVEMLKRLRGESAPSP